MESLGRGLAKARSKSFLGRMADADKLYVVTQNGAKVSAPMPLAEANAKAAEMRRLFESKGEVANIAVAQVLMG